ncbi:MAG: helix-turn-helix domain-containing protein [Melioribacteraceae bacterium]|nr:helix-turn-helix domain-containing protein [Melioribacteraceae bacterium]
MNELLKNFGDELKSVREAKNVSLQQVYNKIRIDVKFLSAIENGDYEILPEIYIRAFIKEYAQYLNLDVNETINKYEFAKKGLVQSEIIADGNLTETTIKNPKETEPTKDIIELQIENQSNTFTIGSLTLEKKTFFSVLAILIIFLVVGSISTYLFIDSSPKIITDNSDIEITPPPSSRYEEIQKPVVKPVGLIELDSLTLSISTTTATWIKVMADKREMFKEVLTPENPIEIKADTLFEVSVQFPAVIIAKLNGKNLGVLASGNELWHLKIDSTGVFKSFKIVNTKNDSGN